MSGLTVDPEGRVVVATSHSIWRQSEAGTLSLWAGGEQGFSDGSRSEARFSGASGLAFGQSGLLYVADSGNNRIRVIKPDGTVSTLAGRDAGFSDGDVQSARFSNPRGVTTDATGDVIVADSDNNRIRMITPEGKVLTIAGTGKRANPSDDPTTFGEPLDVGVASNGDVYMASTSGIYRISAGVVSPLYLMPVYRGISEPWNDDLWDREIAVGRDGTLFYVDCLGGGDRLGRCEYDSKVIKKRLPTGEVSNFSNETFLHWGIKLALDADSHDLYVYENNGQVMTRLSPEGVAQTLFRNPGGSEISTLSSFAVTKTSGATSLIAATFNGKVFRISFDGKAELLPNTFVSAPGRLAIDQDGTIVAVEGSRIVRISSDGEKTILAGSKWGFRDGPPGSARFNRPRGLAIGDKGAIFVADRGNRRVRKITR